MKMLLDKAPAASIELPSKKLKLTKQQSGIISSSEDDEDGFEDQVWLQYHGCLLTECDKTMIELNDLLSDMHINNAQTLLYITSFLMFKDCRTHFSKTKNHGKRLSKDR